MKLPYKVVDVFTFRPLLGNPVAVIMDAEGLTDDAMQAVARWTNLSETTFVLPPTTADADYRLRIFTPRSELPFAGHPTLGSAHAILEAGRVTLHEGGRLIQECGIGLVELTIEEREAQTANSPSGCRLRSWSRCARRTWRNWNASSGAKWT